MLKPKWYSLAAEGGNFRVISPSYFLQRTLVLLTVNGEQLETAEFTERTEKGANHRYIPQGSTWPPNILLRVGHTDCLVNAPGRSN